VNNTIAKLEKARRRAEADFQDAKKKLASLSKQTGKDTSTKGIVEAETRKLKTRLVEEQDRAAAAESERRRAEVEISKLRDDVRTLSDELERARSDARTAADDKRELEDKARAIAGLWK